MVIHNETQIILDQIMASMPHALIVTGNRGVGLTSIAQQIASQLQSPKLVISPKRKLENGKKIVTDYEKGSIIIDDIRDLYTLTRSKNAQNQVYIFDFGDRTMTQQAQNAFLKLLEEPRANVYFILATHREDALLPTIRSRAQTLRVRNITRAQSEQLLDDLSVVDQTKRARILFASAGLPELIEQLAMNETSYENRIAVMQDAKILISGSAYDKLKVIQKYKDDRPGVLLLLDDVTLQLESVLRRSGDVSIAKQIERHMKTRQTINDNGNIRLQLAADML